MRIVSFLPAATEMVCALGLTDQLVGITHECDFPPEVRGKPVVVRPAIDMSRMTLAEIDRAVSNRIGSGQSLYQVDEALLKKLQPDLIITQNLCQVCAPSGNEVSQVLKALNPVPRILWMSPQSLDGVFQNILELGEATSREERATALVTEGRQRLDRVAQLSQTAGTRPRVFCLEWVDPIYNAGHWMGEMVESAGGVDQIACKGGYSVRIDWNKVREWAPEVLVIAPCGFGLDRALEQAPQLFSLPGWNELPAVRSKRVFTVDANAYFARPGPRLVEGTELLAHLIHPELFPWTGSDDFRRVA